jgi:hypothetical protein
MNEVRTAPDEPGDEALFRLQQELRLLEEEIDQTRRAAAEFRQWIGGRSEGATDVEDRSAAIAQVEEQEQLLRVLLVRRDSLRERIRDQS